MPRMKISTRDLLAVAAMAAFIAASPIGGSSSAKAASAGNVVIETGTARYAMKTIELQGTGLTDADLALLFDLKAAAPIGERFAKLTASTILIPELIVTTKAEPSQTLIYQNIKLTNVQQGKAEAADIEGAHFSTSDPNAGTIDGTYGHIHAQSIDMTLAAHIMSEVRKAESESMKSLYDRFSIDEFKMKASGQQPLTMTVANISGGHVKGRALAKRPSDFQSAASDPVQLAALMKDGLTSFEMEELTATDIAIQSESDGKPVTISLGKMSIAHFGDAKIGDIDFGPLEVNAQGSTVKIDDIDFKDISFQRLQDFKPKPTVKDNDPDADTSQQTAAFIPNVAAFIVSKIDVKIANDNPASGETKGAFSIDRFEMDSGKPVDATPTQVTAALDHFILDLSSLKEADVKSLTDMGYSKLDLSSNIDLAWDAGTEALSINDVSLKGANMGAIKLSGLIGNVTKDFFSGDATTMQAAAFGALIKKVELRIDNAGFFEKAETVQAKAQNKSIEDIKQSYVAAAAIGLPAMLDNKPAAKMIGAALAKFVANPKSFYLSATSADGLGAADFALMKDPATLLDAVEVKATANE